MRDIASGMRSLLIIPLLVIPGSASAESTKAMAKTLATGTDVCKDLGGAKCVAAGKLKTKLGAATIYRSDNEQVKITFAIDTGKEIIVAPAFEDMKSNCGAGKCVDLVRVTPKLSEVKVGGTDAVALTLTLDYAKSLNEPPKTKTTWKTTTFVVCGKTDRGYSCVTTAYGGQGVACTAALSAKGDVKHTCTETETLAF